MTKNKRSELDLDAEAQAALDEARAMSQDPERAAAMKKAGILRKAADSHGIIYAKRGRWRSERNRVRTFSTLNPSPSDWDLQRRHFDFA